MGEGRRYDGLRTSAGELGTQGISETLELSQRLTNEGGANGKGDDKELRDLLIVFGKDVLLFSDKDRAYENNVDVSVAWPRWYRNAIDKSVRQFAGATSDRLISFNLPRLNHYPCSIA